MKIYIKQVKNLVIPQQATQTDSGFDIVATTNGVVVGQCINFPLQGLKLYSSIDYIEYQTNLAVAYDNEMDYLKIYPRSSISKYNLMLKNSVPIIDNGYRAPIVLRFCYIAQGSDYHIIQQNGRDGIFTQINQEKIYRAGNKIGQLIPDKRVKVLFELVEKLPDSQRNLKGLGSSGV